MNKILWLEFNLGNAGFKIETYWFDLAIPMRTILIGLAVFAGVKIYKRRKNNG